MSEQRSAKDETISYWQETWNNEGFDNQIIKLWQQILILSTKKVR